MIPLMMVECVEQRTWLSEEDFAEALAMCSVLPGPIAAKMSVYIGYRVAGIPGAIVAFVMVMAPALALMTGLTALYLRTRESPIAQGAMTAVKPAVVGLLAWVAFKLGTQSIEGLSSLAIGGLAFAALSLRVHPALVMCGAMLMGALMMRPSA